jgi:hypothetical protein
LNAAADLFNSAGIRGATVDAIAAKAGITKKTLYYHFRSKDDLVAASLCTNNLAEYESGKFAMPRHGSLTDLVKSMFADVACFAADPYWQGCAFTRAAFELAGMPGHPGVAAAKAHKSRLEDMFFQELASIGSIAARAIARRLILLLDGAITHSVVYHDPEYATEAGRLALELISSPVVRENRKGETITNVEGISWSELASPRGEGRSRQLGSGAVDFLAAGLVD